MIGVAMNGGALGAANEGFQPDGADDPDSADGAQGRDPRSGQGGDGRAARRLNEGGARAWAGGSTPRLQDDGHQQMLSQIERTSEALLTRVHAAQSSPSATQSLELSLTADAQRLLNVQLRDALAALDGGATDAQRARRVATPGADHPDRCDGDPGEAISPSRDRLLQVLCDLARQADLEGARQQLAEDLCVTANGLRQVVSQASPGDLQRLVTGFSVPASAGQGAGTTDPAGFESLVAEVRGAYGAARGTAQPLRSATDIAPDVERIVESLKPGLMEALKRFHLSPQDHEQAGVQALQQAAVILVDHELDTPATVQAFLDHARRADDWLAFTTGLLGQVGYPVGMAAFLWGVGPSLAPVLLGAESGFRGAAAFGAVAGAMIGYFDSVAGAGASAVRSALSYAGSGGSTSPLVAAMKASEPRDIGTRLGISALATFTKNALLRAVVPSVVYAAAYPQGVSRAVRDHVDFAGDAGGGLFSGAAATLWTRRALESRSSQDFKLLTQDNLPDLIERARSGPRWSWGAVQSLSAYGRGLGAGALAPSTFAVTGLVMTPLVALLMGINIGVVPGLALSEVGEGAGRGGDDVLRSGNEGPDWNAEPGMPGAVGGSNGTTASAWTTAAGPSSQANILAAEHALKATVSSLLMAVLAGAATGVGQWVGRHADADCLGAVFGAVRSAAQRLRGTSCASGAAGTGTAVALTAVRRRAVAGGEPGRGVMRNV